MTYRKVGGLHHWRIGRLGGSFYLLKPVPINWVNQSFYACIAIIILSAFLAV
jgi:hypothetical protein